MSDRYEIIKEIGQGGLGAVYKALDTQLNREVAIKRVLGSQDATPEEVQAAADALVAEAQVLSSLNHPNIVTVFDVSQDEKGGFVVMELLKGETIDQLVARGVLTQDDFAEVVYQTMDGLMAAQAKDLIHRDIKPSNIMVVWLASGKFQLKLLDFGLAKFSKNPSVQTMDQEDSVMGSIFFMAPEQFERGELDARTDLYQIGCVYYNALTGEYPFTGETAPQVMNAHLQHRVVPLDEIRPDLHPHLCQWVMWLINKDINHRPANAAEAMKHFPKNLDEPVVQESAPAPANIVVEEPVSRPTRRLNVVTGARSAKAPPSLIVQGGSAKGTQTRLITSNPANQGAGAAPTRTRVLTTGGPAKGRAASASRNLQTGTATTTLRRGGKTTTVVRKGGAGKTTTVIRRKSQKLTSKEKGLGLNAWLLIGAGICLAIGGIIFGISAAGKKADRELIAKLAGLEAPKGGSEEVSIAADILNSDDSSANDKRNAAAVLSKMEGSGISQTVLGLFNDRTSITDKIQLAHVLSARDYGIAAEDIAAAIPTAQNDEQKESFVSALQGFSSVSTIEPLIKILSNDFDSSIDRGIEEVILKTIRAAPSPDRFVDQMIGMTSNNAGDEQKSIFRILGAVATPKVDERLEQIYASASNEQLQRDAILAYLAWPNRDPLDKIKGIAIDTPDPVLKRGAEEAYLRMAVRPSADPLQEKLEDWREAFNFMNSPSQARGFLNDLLAYAQPEVAAFLGEMKTHPKYGALAASTAQTLGRAINANTKLAKTGISLAGNRAKFAGGRSVKVNSEMGAAVEWTSSTTWLYWNVLCTEAGSYKLDLEASNAAGLPNQLNVYVSSWIKNVDVPKTENWEEFQPISLDTAVSLEDGVNYTIFIAAGDRVQPRLPNIRSLNIKGE